VGFNDPMILNEKVIA